MYTTYDDSIYFIYEREGIFDDIRQLSTFMAKNAANKEGQPMLEQYAITEDEAPMFGLCLRDCLPDVWELMVKLTHGVEDAYQDAKTFTAEEVAELATKGITVSADKEYVTFRIVNNGAYNPNILKVVDASIRSTIEQGVMEKWYTRIAQADLLKMASLGFTSESSSLSRRLMQLLRKSVYPPQS